MNPKTLQLITTPVFAFILVLGWIFSGVFSFPFPTDLQTLTLVTVGHAVGSTALLRSSANTTATSQTAAVSAANGVA